MKEKLIIKNFGPIKSVELELGRFNVLIGEQATGKSTVAKLLAVCRYFSYITGNEGYLKIMDSSFHEGLVAWGLTEALKDDSYIYYECEHYSFEANQTKIYLDEDNDIESLEKDGHWVFQHRLIPRSNEFTALLAELDRIKPKLLSTANLTWRPPTSFFQNDVARVMDNPFYMPAERGLQSIFSLGKSSIQNISDSLFNQLANLDRIARLFKNETMIEPLDIVYKNVEGRGYIRKSTDKQFYSLFNAATGYQSTIPVVLLVKYYSDIRKKDKTFIIEEPELNLFPTAQDALMQYLVAQVMKHDSSVLLATHSPYILTSVNNMMYAYRIGQSKPDRVNNVVAEAKWLNPEEVSAYRLMSDGTAISILDSELKQIDAGQLDEVSRKINTIWDQIADIEYDNAYEN